MIFQIIKYLYSFLIKYNFKYYRRVAVVRVSCSPENPKNNEIVRDVPAIIQTYKSAMLPLHRSYEVGAAVVGCDLRGVEKIKVTLHRLVSQ